jgi:hypothetical protein
MGNENNDENAYIGSIEKCHDFVRDITRVIFHESHRLLINIFLIWPKFVKIENKGKYDKILEHVDIEVRFLS